MQMLIDNEFVYDEMVIKNGYVMAFDFGEKRIGVAGGASALGLAMPLALIEDDANNLRFQQIATLIAEWQPKLLVVGLPMSMQGEAHKLTHLCKKFARRLNGRFNLPVMLVDERLSSIEASQFLSENGIRGRKQKPLLDQVAAQIILQSYFDYFTAKLHEAT